MHDSSGRKGGEKEKVMWIGPFVFLSPKSLNLEGGLNITATLWNLLQKIWKIQAYMIFPPIN